MKKLLLLGILFSLLALQSCGNKDKTADTKKDDKTTEQTATDDKKSDNTNAVDTKTDGKKENNDPNGLGMSSGLPQDFPKDIPQPNNSKCNGYLGSSDGTVVTFESKDNLKSLIDFYKAQMDKSGYKSQEGNEYFQNENGAMLGYKKGNKEVGFLFGVNKENNITQIVITYK
jgi:hypothetical protein